MAEVDERGLMNTATLSDRMRDFHQKQMDEAWTKAARVKLAYKTYLALYGTPRAARRQMSKDGWTRAWIVYADLSHWGMI